MRQIQPIKLNLLRRKYSQLLNEPVVERAMILKLQRAQRVRDTLDRIRLPMRVVVHGINAPLISGSVMLRVQNAVHHRIAHVQVRRSHIDLRPQSTRAIGKFSGAHALKQIKILFDRPVAIRAIFAGFRQSTAVLPNFICRQIVDVRLAFLDQFDCPFVKLIEIIGGVEQTVPLKAEPVHIRLDRLDVLGFFLLGIGVVEAEIGMSAKLGG